MNSELKVLFLNYIPSPYRVDFFNELAQSCNLSVVYYHSVITERPNWHYIPEQHHYEHTILFKNEYGYKLNGYFKLLKILTEKKNSIIVVGGYAHPIEMFAILMLRILNIPFVLNTDGGFYQGNKFKLALKRWLVKSASWYLANGSVAAKTFERYGAAPHKIFNYHFSSLYRSEILDKPVAPEIKNKLKHELKMPQNQFILLTIGRYIPLKGFELVIEAISLINRENVSLYLVGEGEMRPKYQALVDKYKLNDRVFLVGEQSKNKVLQLCKAADCMVLPTLTSDVWGLVVNEAMSCGLPVIASDRVGAAYDLIKHGETGYMVKTGSSMEIKNAINNIMDDSKEFSSNSLNLVQFYTIEQMAADHIQLFKLITRHSK